MSVSILRYIARVVKGILAQITQLINSSPIIQPGCLYSQEQIMAKCGVSKTTLGRWELAGLQNCRPGTSKVFYYADDILKVMRIPADELPVYEPKYKRKE